MPEARPEPLRSKQIYCNSCKAETHHVLRGAHRRSWHEDDGYWEEVTYGLWTCAGCDTGTMEAAWTSAAMHHEDEQHFDYTYSPPRAASDLPQKVFRQLPKPLSAIYREVVLAFNNQLPVLCAAGLRALIEGICDDKKIGGGTLEKKIDALEAILPKNIVQHLHGFRFMGNEALHELGAPDRGTLGTAIEVSEDLLNFLYELDYKASRLPKKKATP